MKTKKIVLKNEVGLHARAASLFVQAANKFVSDVYLELRDKRVNAKSIMGVMALGVFQGEEITLIARGEDENEAVEKLVDLLENELNNI